MDPREYLRITSHVLKSILPPLERELRYWLNRPDGCDWEALPTTIALLEEEGRQDYCDFLDVKEFSQLKREHQWVWQYLFVRGFNLRMGRKCTHLLVLLYYRARRKFDIKLLSRSAIPGIHDSLSEAIAPYIQVAAPKDIRGNKIVGRIEGLLVVTDKPLNDDPNLGFGLPDDPSR
jgi:hypothetical protein